MGQQTSLPEGPRPHGNVRTFLKGTGSLGLSRAELDKRCKPSGLYPSCKWEDKVIRRLIGDGKLAARLKGHEHRTTPNDQECPICFLQCSQVNVTKCCNAYICTECFLQVKPPKQKAFECPFCNSPKFSVKVAEDMDEEGLKEREMEEQKNLQAAVRARANTMGSVSSNEGDEITDHDTFGASLERHKQLMRKRSESGASSDDSNAEAEISLVAMTPEEREALRAEIQAQACHPLTMRLEQEERQRRVEREHEYYERQARRLMQIRSQRERLRHSIEQRYGAATADSIMRRSSRGDRGLPQFLALQGNSTGAHIASLRALEEYVVLEATIRLNLQEEARIVQETGIILEGGDSDGRPRWHLEGSSSHGDMVLPGYSEEEQLAMAIQASLQESISNMSVRSETVVEQANVIDERPSADGNGETSFASCAADKGLGPSEQHDDIAWMKEEPIQGSSSTNTSLTLADQPEPVAASLESSVSGPTVNGEPEAVDDETALEKECPDSTVDTIPVVRPDESVLEESDVVSPESSPSVPTPP